MNRNQASGLQSPGPRVSVDQVEPCSHLSVTSLSFPPASEAQLLPRNSQQVQCGPWNLWVPGLLLRVGPDPWLPKMIRGHLPFSVCYF